MYLLMVSPLIYLAIIYKSLPQKVAMHFDLHGNPDRYGNKSELIFLQILLLAITVGLYLLITNLQKIDPKKGSRMSEGTMQKIAIAVVFLLSGLSFMTIVTAKYAGFNSAKVIVPFTGLFMAYFGNIMYTIKPNYFVGIRTPWALEDGDTWRKTHMLAGKLWFAGGLLICLLGLLLPSEFAVPILVVIMFIASLIPAGYSYIYFRKVKRRQ